MPLTPESPLPARLLAWASERFPPAQAPLLFIMYAVAVLYGRLLTSGGGALRVGARDVVSFLAAYGFFLMLRVFDEHKDYELDCRNHPQRVLQSGLISLGHLKVLGAVAIAAQAGISLWRDGWVLGPITSAWLAVMAYALLMAKEFFIGVWLKDRLLLYAVTHMMVMPLSLVWMALMGADGARLPGSVALLALLSFLSGFAFEIARKLKAPADERPTVDSYTKVLGVVGAPAAIAGLLLAGVAVIAVLLHTVYGGAAPLLAYAAIGVATAGAMAALWSFSREPSGRRAKTCEAMSGLAMLSANVVLSAAILLHRGVAWA